MHLIYGILEKPVHSLQAINISAIYRGLQRVQLLKPDITIPKLPSNKKTMEITAPDVIIPSKETTYWCYMTKLPRGFRKHYIIMVRGRRRALLSPVQTSNHGHIQPFCKGHPFSALSQGGFQNHLPQHGNDTPPRATPLASSILMSPREPKIRSFSAGGRRLVTFHPTHRAGTRAGSEQVPCRADPLHKVEL